MSDKLKIQMILFLISIALCVGSYFVIDDARIFIGVAMFFWGSNIANFRSKL